MLVRFAEPEPRVHQNPVLRDPAMAGIIQTVPEVTDKFAHHILINRFFLHGFRLALHVHEKDRDFKRADGLSHPGVHGHGADPVATGIPGLRDIVGGRHRNCSHIERAINNGVAGYPGPLPGL